MTFDLNHRGKFEPRIPENAEEYGEDYITKRVCVSDDIVKALTSIPKGDNLEDLNGTNIFKVFIIDTDLLNIDISNIIKPNAIKNIYNVSDAEVTNEHWITVPFQCDNYKLYKFSEVVFDVVDIVEDGWTRTREYIKSISLTETKHL